MFELIVILFMIAVVAKVAIPRYSGVISRYRLTNSANQIVTDLNNARNQALATSANVTMTFTVATQSYTIANMPGLDSHSAVYAVSLANYPFKISGLGASFGGGGTTLIFDGYGMPSNPGTITVIAGGSMKTITVEATSGKVTVQ